MKIVESTVIIYMYLLHKCIAIVYIRYHIVIINYFQIGHVIRDTFI